jgi:outer membrane biosynthesis protein TonB
MPTNSDYDGFFAGIGGIPLFTYGMITITTIVLAYVTIMESDEVVEEMVDSTVPNSPFMTNLAPPLPEPANEAANEPTEEPINEPTEEPINEATEEEPANEPVNEVIEEPINEVTEEEPVLVENKGGKKRRKTLSSLKIHKNKSR